MIVAVPVGARSAVKDLRDFDDAVTCLHNLRPFDAVGAGYDDFTQISDGEVLEVLHAAQTTTCVQGGGVS